MEKKEKAKGIMDIFATLLACLSIIGLACGSSLDRFSAFGVYSHSQIHDVARLALRTGDVAGVLALALFALAEMPLAEMQRTKRGSADSI